MSAVGGTGKITRLVQASPTLIKAEVSIIGKDSGKPETLSIDIDVLTAAPVEAAPAAEAPDPNEGVVAGLPPQHPTPATPEVAPLKHISVMNRSNVKDGSVEARDDVKSSTETANKESKIPDPITLEMANKTREILAKNVIVRNATDGKDMGRISAPNTVELTGEIKFFVTQKAGEKTPVIMPYAICEGGKMVAARFVKFSAAEMANIAAGMQTQTADLATDSADDTVNM